MKTFNAYDFFIEQRNIKAGNFKTNMIISKHEKITYGDFHQSVTEKYASFFRQIDDCSRMGILLFDSVFQQILFWGALRSGITPGIFSIAQTQESVLKTINAASIDILIAGQDHIQTAKAAVDFCKLKRVYIVDENCDLKLLYQNPKLPEREKEGRVILFSSGTTGISKGILHDQIDMKYAASTYGEQVLKLGNQDILYSMATLNYGFAFTNSTFQAVYGGSSAIIDKDVDIWDIVDNIKKFNPTVICGVPAIFDALANVSRASQLDLGSVRLALSSGEKMPESLWNRLNDEFKIEVIEGYGSVEMLTNVISNNKESFLKGSSGKILEGFEYQLEKLDPDGDEKSSGVLKVKGPSISNMTIESQENKSKIYITRDVFKVDLDGFFHYCGRKDDMYKVNGVWFSPLEVEKHLESLQIFSGATVVNVNMEIVAYVTLKDPELLDFSKAQSITRWLRRDKNQMICPSKYIVVETLLRNFNGKKLRVEIDKKHIIKTVEV